MNKKKTILNIVDDGLCCGCGTCVGLCKENAIDLYITNEGVYLPDLNLKKCNNCGICYEVCPGLEVDFKNLNNEIFGSFPANSLIGNYFSCYLGYSNDSDIRYNSSSGGLITQILIDALENGIIDGAIVTKMKNNDPLRPEPFIARTKKEIIKASQSKYCPVPVNTILNEILKTKNEKFAIVGLSCHIHGIRKAEAIYKDLKDKIILHFGIVCNHSPSFLATEFLLDDHDIKKEEIKKISYRGKGWPGKMTIVTKDDKLELSQPVYWGSGFGQNFIPIRCTLCCDHMAELSDISFADAWLPEIKENDNIGTSIIIIRKASDILLKTILSNNNIQLTILDPLKVTESQSLNLIFKKKAIKSRMNVIKLFNKKSPYYNNDTLSDPEFLSYPGWIFYYLKLFLFQKRSFWKLNRFRRSFLQKLS